MNEKSSAIVPPMFEFGAFSNLLSPVRVVVGLEDGVVMNLFVQ